MTDKAQIKLDKLIRANYPVIVINSHEESRVTKQVRRVVEAQAFTDANGRAANKALWQWTTSAGLVKVLGETGPDEIEDTQEPLAALTALKTWAEDVSPEATVFLFKDLHNYMPAGPDGKPSGDPRLFRNLRDLVLLFQGQPNTLILLSPAFSVPDDLRKDAITLDWPLPDEDELGAIVDRAVRRLKASKAVKVDMPDDVRAEVVSALRGLSEFEAASVLSMAAVTNLALDAQAIPIILAEKKAIIKASGYLEFIETQVADSDIGGLAALKAYAGEVAQAYKPEARAFGLDKPSGVFLVGWPGSGKSLTVKMLGQGKRPVLRLDLSALKGGIVGATEQNTLAALRVVDAAGDCVLMLDEVEKALGGANGMSLDGGASVGQFGILLTWMEERKARGSGAYIAATANGANLPPEFLRRFDDIFFVDCPAETERVEIAAIHIRKSGRAAEAFDLKAIAQATREFSGDEIRKAIQAAVRRAFVDGARELTTADIVSAARQMTPLSATDPERLAELRKWAKTRARNAHKLEGEPETQAAGKAPARKGSKTRLDLGGLEDDED